MNRTGLQHLCLTQSPLITLVFQTAMKHLEIPAGSLKSISRRSVKPAAAGMCLDDLSAALEAHYKKADRRGYLASRAELVQKVREITDGEKFLAYLPHLQRLFYQEIVAHPDCEGYLFVEEGFTSMDWQARQAVDMNAGKRALSALRAWWTGSRFDAQRAMFDIADRKFRGAISISPQAFSGMTGVVNVAPWIPRYHSTGGPKNVYVILDTSYLHRGIRWEDYEKAAVVAILTEAAEAASIRVKFHFADTQASAHFESMRQKCAATGGLTLLESDFSVEDHLTADDRLLFGVSSLGYYAAIFGGRVKCFAPEVAGLDLPAWIRRGLLPRDFPEVVGLPPSP